MTVCVVFPVQVDSSVHLDPLALPPVDPLLLTELRAKLEHKHQQLATKEGQDIISLAGNEVWIGNESCL